jgi:hypothetical protein
MVTALLVGAAGVMVGWLVGFLSEATEVTRDDLDSYRLSDDDLVDWDRHTKGGRRG